MLAAVLIALVAWASSALWLGASAAPVQHRADAEAVAIHGFYDHENLVPVPLFNLSVPYASASFEPGPSTEALGSFLYEREAANLSNIMCALSGNQFCQLPPYPFQARAAHPSSGDESPPPTLTIDEDGAPVAVRAAHEEAAADARGARAEANVERLAAIPMTGAQARRASDLAAALTLATGRPQSASEWLVAVRTAGADAEVAEGGPSIRSESRSIVRGLELLGGLVTVEKVRGRAEASTRDGGVGAAEADVAGVRVADLRARVGPRGVTIVDQSLGAEEAAELTEALNGALADAGLRVRPGDERVETGEDGVSAEAFALSIDFRRRVLPEELPEGATGDDVVRIPLGWARAAAASTEVAAVEDVAPAPVDVPPLPSAEIGSDLAIADDASAPTLESAPAPAAPAAASYAVALAIPPSALVAVIAGALLALAAMVWLKIVEVLAE